MPTLSVALAGGEEVLPKTFFCDDGSLKQLVDPAARRLGVDPMRCVLLSPTGNRMAHSATPSQEELVDGDVVTLLVVGATLLFALSRRQRICSR